MSSIKKYFASSPKDVVVADAGENLDTPDVTNKRSRSDGSSSAADLHVAKRPNVDESGSKLDMSEIEFEGDTPSWVPLMFKAMDSIHGDVALVKSKMGEFCAFQAEVVKRMDEFQKTVEFLSDKFDAQEATINKLADRVANLENEKAELVLQVDNNEQHSRNECLLIHGVAEADGEDAAALFVSTVNDKLGMTTQRSDVKRAHRLGPKRADGKPRPVIARFYSMNVRNDIYYKKKLLKGQRVAITENLTKRRLAALNVAKTTYGLKNVWTQEGRIMAKDKDDKKIYVKI